MKTKLYTGKYEIVDSNTVMVFDKNSSLTIDINTGDFNFSIELTFVVSNNEKPIISKTVDSIKNKIILECCNFNNIFGTNTSVPVEVATVNKRQMYLHLFVSLLEDGIRRINYTIFLDKEAKYE